MCASESTFENVCIKDNRLSRISNSATARSNDLTTCTAEHILL